MSEQVKTKGGLKVYRRLLSFSLPHWKVFVVATFGMLVFSATDAAFAKLIEPMLDGSFVKRDLETIKWVPILIVAVFFVRIISGFLSTYGMAWISRNVIRDLRSQMFNQLLTLPNRYYDHSSSGVLLSKLLYNVEQLAQASSNIISILINQIGLIGQIIGLFTAS